MAYIGRQLVRGTNRVLDDISGSFNGSTATFNLTVDSSASAPGSQNQLWISIGGVFQEPGTDFTVADAQITFTTAPAANLGFWGMIQGDVTDGVAPSDASVSPAKIASTGDFAFPADVRFKDADGSHYVGLQAPTTVSSNLVWTLPAADGSANQYLKTDGSGALSWGSDSATDATKMPLAGGTFTGDVTFDGQTAGRDIVWDRSADNLTFADNAKAVFGTGGDLSVYADGSNSKIVHSGDGGLVIEAAGTDEDITIQATDDVFIKVQGSENAIRCLGDAAVELYHNNVKKVETASNGMAVAGQVDCTGGGVLVDDGYSFSAGTGGDLTVYHNGSNSYVANSTGNLMITGNNSDKIHIRAHASKQEIVCFPSAGVQLFYNDVKKFETTSAGVTVTGGVYCTTDGVANGVQIGAGNDLILQHNGTDSFIDNNTGDLYLQTTGSGDDVIIQAADDIFLKPQGGGESGIEVIGDGGVKLFHDNSKKFETLSTGVRSQGGICFGSDTAAANHLDDYEEGSWTATWYGSSSGTGTLFSTSTNYCTYIRIGRLAYVRAWSVFSNLNSATGNLLIGGLPFSNSGNYTVSSNIRFSTIDNGGDIAGNRCSCYFPDGSTVGYFQTSGTGGEVNINVADDLTATTNVMFTATFEVWVP